MIYRIRNVIISGIILVSICILCGFIIKSESVENRSIVLSEVCSHNQTVAYDYAGEFCDYIELYNQSDEEIDLSGYYLSEEYGGVNPYVIEEVVIGPNEYELVFLNLQNEGSFSLKDGDSLYLFDNQGELLDSVGVPILGVDSVLARDFATNVWKNNVVATPWKANEITENAYVINEDETIIPRLSKSSGFYDEAFLLEITAKDGYDIYYTLDGSIPTDEAMLYTEPVLIEDVSSCENVYSSIANISVEEAYTPNFEVDKCNVVRAVAVSQTDGSYSHEVCASYFVGYNDRYGYDNVHILSLVTDPENLFSNDRGIYVIGDIGEENWSEDVSKHRAITNYSREGKGWQREARVELYNNEKKKLYSEEINISIHGGYSVLFNQKGFNLIADENNVGNSSYIFPGLYGEKSTSLMLRAGGYRDLYSTKFRDALNHQLVEDRDLTILRAMPCQVFLNGEYWGLYNLQERISPGLIENKYGVNAEDVIIIKNSNVVGGDDADFQIYEDVVRFAKNNDLSIEKNYQKMESMIDIQSYIDYYCFQIYVANCDSVGNNYSCWRTKTISGEEYYDGKWRWVLYDTDDSLGMVGGLACHYTDSFIEGHWALNPMEDDLFSSLLKNEGFKKQFVKTFVEMADMNFDFDYVNEIVDGYCDEYMEPTVVSHRRFMDEGYTEEQYIAEVEVIKEFFYKRKDDIIQYMVDDLEITDLEMYLKE